MMQVLLDTNILLDLVLERDDFVEAAAQVWEAHRTGRCEAFVSAITPGTVAYLVHRNRGPEAARRAAHLIVEGLNICAVDSAVDSAVLYSALNLPMNDFEDAIQAAAAQAAHLDAVVTRDVKDFAHSPLPALSPAAFLAQLA
jgi:predicted nucleic acid-binding protein